MEEVTQLWETVYVFTLVYKQGWNADLLKGIWRDHLLYMPNADIW